MLANYYNLQIDKNLFSKRVQIVNYEQILYLVQKGQKNQNKLFKNVLKTKHNVNFIICR